MRPAPATARGRVVAIPHSGAGPNALLPLLRRLSADLDVIGVNLPGRERRFAEEFADLPARTAEVVESIAAELRAAPPMPTVLFGHSLGASIAIALSLADPDVARALVLSGHAYDPARLQDDGAVLTEEELLSVLRLGTGTPREFLEEPEFRQYILGLLDCDLTLGRRLAHSNALALDSGRPLPVPVRVLGGASDQLVDAAALPGWERFAAAGFSLRTFAGGHFYLLDEEIMDEVAHEITAAFERRDLAAGVIA
ncbi:thioesterase II family protein [Catenulispora subtropica]|uniref:thioesterase II family protein n=1 Tax=Catenulispora subtropica TaxID=450798 RepID=UPI0031DFFA41